MRSLLFVLLVVAAFCQSASAQNGGKAEVFPSQQIREHMATLGSQAATSGSAGLTLADYGSHKLQISVRTSSGGAEIHAHYDDVMIVQEGTATLIVGGAVIDAKANADGETKGTGIQGGKSQSIAPGDIVTVNAGVPHQLLVPAGTIYSALVIKVRE
jgi:mannose-6-phosphate isomerase-like protein (cupin superfamily)